MSAINASTFQFNPCSSQEQTCDTSTYFQTERNQVSENLKQEDQLIQLFMKVSYKLTRESYLHQKLVSLDEFSNFIAEEAIKYTPELWNSDLKQEAANLLIHFFQLQQTKHEYPNSQKNVLLWQQITKSLKMNDFPVEWEEAFVKGYQDFAKRFQLSQHAHFPLLEFILMVLLTSKLNLSESQISQQELNFSDYYFQVFDLLEKLTVTDPAFQAIALLRWISKNSLQPLNESQFRTLTSLIPKFNPKCEHIAGDICQALINHLTPETLETQAPLIIDLISSSNNYIVCHTQSLLGEFLKKIAYISPEWIFSNAGLLNKTFESLSGHKFFHLEYMGTSSALHIENPERATALRAIAPRLWKEPKFTEVSKEYLKEVFLILMKDLDQTFYLEDIKAYLSYFEGCEKLNISFKFEKVLFSSRFSKAMNQFTHEAQKKVLNHFMVVFDIGPDSYGYIEEYLRLSEKHPRYLLILRQGKYLMNTIAENNVSDTSLSVYDPKKIILQALFEASWREMRASLLNRIEGGSSLNNPVAQLYNRILNRESCATQVLDILETHLIKAETKGEFRKKVVEQLLSKLTILSPRIHQKLYLRMMDFMSGILESSPEKFTIDLRLLSNFLERAHICGPFYDRNPRVDLALDKILFIHHQTDMKLKAKLTEDLVFNYFEPYFLKFARLIEHSEGCQRGVLNHSFHLGLVEAIKIMKEELRCHIIQTSQSTLVFQKKSVRFHKAQILLKSEPQRQLIERWNEKINNRYRRLYILFGSMSFYFETKIGVANHVLS